MYGVFFSFGVLVIQLTLGSTFATEEVLFDFSASSSTAEGWEEVSDTTARSAGFSKASFDIIGSETNRRAVFFSLLVPQPDSACFAGVQTMLTDTKGEGQDWSAFNYLRIDGAVSQGNNHLYKAILKDNNANSSIDFEHYFLVKEDSPPIQISLSLSDFLCSYHGQSCPDVLNHAHVSQVGLQIAGGVYSQYTQQGVASLELTSVSIA
jgi:hypothetical protein